MLAEQLLREGKLQAALDALQEDVRHAPSDAKLRNVRTLEFSGTAAVAPQTPSARG